MRRNQLHYDLPPERIAQRPLDDRDAARLLVLNRGDERMEHRVFRELPQLLRAGDCLVLNQSRVLPARFTARRSTGGRLSGLFLLEHGPGHWRVMLEGAGRLRPNERLTLEHGDWIMTWLGHVHRGQCDVRIHPPDAAARVLNVVGRTPLPPYIRRQGRDGASDPQSLADSAGCDAEDRDAYQTVYATKPGSVAAPTAGLHFTPALLDAIRADDVHVAKVVLHVGPGTFQPIEADDLADHRMHPEWYELPPSAADAVNRCRSAGGRIFAVGTTSVRVLETCASEEGVRAGTGWTDLFIYPPRRFRVVDGLITNFHLPGSTLLALVCAFAGRDRTLRAYRAAIERKYRFYSYGDAMMIR